MSTSPTPLTLEELTRVAYERRFPELRVDHSLLAVLAADLRGNEHVKLLNLNRNHEVTDSCVSEIEAVLPHCAIEHVRVGWTAVSKPKAAAIHDACMRKQLARLRADDASLVELRWNYLVPEGQHTDPAMPGLLCDALRNNTHLLKLDLCHYPQAVDVVERLPAVLPTTRLEQVRCTRVGPGPGPRLQRLCEINRRVRLSLESHRPYQRLLLSAVHASMAPALPDALTFDLLEMIAARLAATRSCPFSRRLASQQAAAAAAVAAAAETVAEPAVPEHEPPTTFAWHDGQASEAAAGSSAKKRRLAAPHDTQGAATAGRAGRGGAARLPPLASEQLLAWVAAAD